MILNTYTLSNNEIFYFNIIHKINNNTITLDEFKLIFFKFKDNYIINLIIFCFLDHIVKKNIDINNIDFSFFKLKTDFFLLQTFNNHINSFLNFIYINHHKEYTFFYNKFKSNAPMNLSKLFNFLKKNKIISNYKFLRIILIKFEYFFLKFNFKIN